VPGELSLKDRYEHELEMLEHGTLCSFFEWPNPEIPDVTAGLYSVWRQHNFIYVGMSGRDLTAMEPGVGDCHTWIVMYRGV